LASSTASRIFYSGEMNASCRIWIFLQWNFWVLRGIIIFWRSGELYPLPPLDDSPICISSTRIGS
jgi:hypothetical protein